jgi:hypothetical protein
VKCWVSRIEGPSLSKSTSLRATSNCSHNTNSFASNSTSVTTLLSLPTTTTKTTPRKMSSNGYAVAKLGSGDHALLGFDTKTTNPNHLMDAEVESSFLASTPGNRDNSTLMVYMKQRDGVKSFASYIEGSSEDVLNDANGSMIKGANVIKTFSSLQDGSTWMKIHLVSSDIHKVYMSMIETMKKHTNMSTAAMNKITIGALANFNPSKIPRLSSDYTHRYDSYTGDDGCYARNARASAVATHDEFLEDQVNNDEVSLAVSNDDTEICYDVDGDNAPTANIPAIASVPVTVSIPDPAPSSATAPHDDIAVLIVHNLENSRVDVASELYLKFINTFSDLAKQMIFEYVHNPNYVDQEIAPFCFPESVEAEGKEADVGNPGVCLGLGWWDGGGDVPPPMETPVAQEYIVAVAHAYGDDGGGKPRAEVTAARISAIGPNEDHIDDPMEICPRPFPSKKRRQLRPFFQQDDSSL